MWVFPLRSKIVWKYLSVNTKKANGLLDSTLTVVYSSQCKLSKPNKVLMITRIFQSLSQTRSKEGSTTLRCRQLRLRHQTNESRKRWRQIRNLIVQSQRLKGWQYRSLLWKWRTTKPLQWFKPKLAFQATYLRRKTLQTGLLCRKSIMRHQLHWFSKQLKMMTTLSFFKWNRLTMRH